MKLFKHIISDKKILKTLISTIIIILAIIFFIREFEANIEIIENFSIKYNFLFLLISTVLFFISYILATYSWKYFINFHVKKHIPFIESLAVFNVSRIINYIPGMIWGYGIQMYWGNKYGISKSLIVFAALVLLICNFLVSLIFFIFYFSVNYNLFRYDLIICN